MGTASRDYVRVVNFFLHINWLGKAIENKATLDKEYTGNILQSCLFNIDSFFENLLKKIKIEQEQIRTNTIAIGFQGTP